MPSTKVTDLGKGFTFPSYFCNMNSQKVYHSITGDGSSTLRSSEFNALFHSQHGAITESQHVFLDAGFNIINLPFIRILEVGFGTGLNAALTAQSAKQKNIKVHYHALELFPLGDNDYKMLNYSNMLTKDGATLWKTVCEAEWNKPVDVLNSFTIYKHNIDFITWIPEHKYHLVYFDAFAPDDQPEMWHEQNFKKIFNAMHTDGVIVTYCVKGTVKKILKKVGFELERLPGPPGKKHMLRAWKKHV